jgi:hypothetical protein
LRALGGKEPATAVQRVEVFVDDRPAGEILAGLEHQRRYLAQRVDPDQRIVRFEGLGGYRLHGLAQAGVVEQGLDRVHVTLDRRVEELHDVIPR